MYIYIFYKDLKMNVIEYKLTSKKKYVKETHTLIFVVYNCVYSNLHDQPFFQRNNSLNSIKRQVV